MQKKPLKAVHLLVLSSIFYLTACGGSSGGNDATPVVENDSRVGIFIDSPVEGLHYKTATQSGVTNNKGEFTFVAGEKVSFSIGGIELPAITAQQILTPLEVFNTTDINNLSVVNLTRLLQTVDSDGDAENGIQILDSTHVDAQAAVVNFASASFDTEVSAAIGDSALVDKTAALEHLTNTIESFTNPSEFSSSWLAGKTLYSVWYGQPGGSLSGNDSAVVEQLSFNADGTLLSVLGVKNSNADETISVLIAENGMFGEENDGNKIVCGGSRDYIKTHYIDAGRYDNTDLLFFDKSKALAFANSLKATIPACESDLLVRIPKANIVLDGDAADWVNIPTVKVDPQGDQNGSASADILSYSVARSGDNIFVKMEMADVIKMPFNSAVDYSFYSLFSHLFTDSSCQTGHDIPYIDSSIFSDTQQVYANGENYGTQYAYQGNTLEIQFNISDLPADARYMAFFVNTSWGDDTDDNGLDENDPSLVVDEAKNPSICYSLEDSSKPDDETSECQQIEGTWTSSETTSINDLSSGSCLDSETEHDTNTYTITQVACELAVYVQDESTGTADFVGSIVGDTATWSGTLVDLDGEGTEMKTVNVVLSEGGNSFSGQSTFSWDSASGPASDCAGTTHLEGVK